MSKQSYLILSPANTHLDSTKPPRCSWLDEIFGGLNLSSCRGRDDSLIFYRQRLHLYLIKTVHYFVNSSGLKTPGCLTLQPQRVRVRLFSAVNAAGELLRCGGRVFEASDKDYKSLTIKVQQSEFLQQVIEHY